MRPKYFALVIVTAYKAARKAVVEQCSEFISSGHAFTHDLALAAVQQYGLVLILLSLFLRWLRVYLISLLVGLGVGDGMW
jgi:hypothetical protein